MMFVDDAHDAVPTFSSGIVDPAENPDAGPVTVDAAQIERILADQYGVEITPTVPVASDGTADPALTAPTGTDVPPVDGGDGPGHGEPRPGSSAGGEDSIPSPPAPSPASPPTPSPASDTRIDPDTGVPIESPMDAIVAENPVVDQDVILVEGPTPGVDAPGPTVDQPPADAPSTPPIVDEHAAPAGFSADEFLRAAYGDVNETLVVGMADMVDRYQRMPPELRQVVDEAFMGRMPAVAQPAPTPAPAPTPQPQPTAQPGFDPWLDDPTAPRPPVVAQPDPQTVAQLEQTRAQLEQIQALEAARIQREVTSAADAAVSAIRTRYPTLTEAEVAGIAFAVNQSGNVTNGLTQGYDPRLVWENTAEQLIWTNPELRSKAIAAQEQIPATTLPPTTQPIPQRTEVDEAQRQARAAAVSGGSGVAQSPLTSLAPPDPRPSGPVKPSTSHVDAITQALNDLQRGA